MDLTFNSRMEAYYQKFIELQDKLRNSEEERLKLEMKFNEMVQVAKEEEQMHYKKLRAQYKRFLEEDRKRQERNERILRNLERIEARISMLTSKTERFKMLRRQYQTYLQRISRAKSSERQANPPPPPPRILVNKPYVSVNKEASDDVINTALDTADDERLNMLDKYLQNLSSQKLEDHTDIARKHLHTDIKYLNDMSKKLEKGFESNEANSIAEDIMNSIYSRHYNKEPLNHELLTTDKSDVASKLGNNSNRESFRDDGNRGRISTTIPDYTGIYPYNLQHISDTGKTPCKNFVQQRNEKDNNNIGLMHFNDNPFTTHKDIGARDDIARNKRYTDFSKNDSMNNVNKNIVATKKSFNDDANKNSRNYSPASYINEHDSEHNNVIGAVKNTVQDSLDIVSDVGNVSNLDKPRVINNEMKRPAIEKNAAAKEKIDSTDMENDGFKLSKSEIDVTENEKHKNDDKDDAKEDEFIGEVNDEESEQVYYNNADEAQDDIVNQMPLKSDEIPSEFGNGQNNGGSNISDENQEQLADPPKPIENFVEELDDSPNLVTKTSDTAAKDADVCEKQIAANEQPDEEEYPSQVNEEQEQIMTELNENKDQYDHDRNASQNINENGDMLQPQYEDVQYNEGNDQTPYYADSAQPTQQEYGEQEGSNQQYYDEGQANEYDQQYNENQQAQLYEESGEVMQEYQGDGQEVNYPYQQQYDENGQPLYQYDENGQAIQQYDENGQPVDIYNQPLLYTGNEQLDENGQPIEAYGEIQQPEQEYEQQQYGIDGQEFQQYDENGQAIYQYGTDPGAVPQYDENGQLLNPQELTGQGSSEQYGENDEQFNQFDESGETIQNQASESQGENNVEVKEDQEEGNGSGEMGTNEGKDQKEEVAEGDTNPEHRKNVLEMLDTDTESLKHNTSKISNDSDFDFSKS